MSVVDNEGKLQVEYTKVDCFSAAQKAVRELNGFTIEDISEISYSITLKGGMSLFSWGEIINITIMESSNGLTEIIVSSTPKIGLGANAPGMYGDMGKNKKNILTVQQAITKELKNYKPNTKKTAADSVADEIKKLAELKEQGILTDEEFSAKKKQLLGI